jgi:hypothetical protein
MGLKYIDSSGKEGKAFPSLYVFSGMDSEVAFEVLGRLLDTLWKKRLLSDEEIEDILGGMVTATSDE